jgi:predicted transcriptional regulator
VRLDSHLARGLRRVAKLSGRPRSEIVRDAVRREVEAEEQILARIRRGLIEADSGLGRPMRDVLSDMARKYHVPGKA